jgi:hypothetical protein
VSTQTLNVVPNIEWDDGVMFVFSWNQGQTLAGFTHIQISLANAVGSQTQVSALVQQISQSQVQFASDPQSWLDTVKTAYRGGKAIAVTFDDSVSANYTTATGRIFSLQQLFSIAG